RGAVIDEPALVRALAEGRIAGAGLDVLEEEPIASASPLLAMDNVIITPHFAGYTDRYPEDDCEASVEAILDMAGGYLPRSVVNPRVKPRWGALAPNPHQ
ncbi:MAG: NAD(P)-dependent oxidoreductase, partial [Anaerolineae bacterium]